MPWTLHRFYSSNDWRFSGLQQANRLRVLQPCIDAGDDDARFHGDQVDADQRYTGPDVDDDAFVQDAVDDFSQTGGVGTLLIMRFLTPFPSLMINLWLIRFLTYSE